METGYLLEHFGDVVGIIITTDDMLKEKLTTSIKDNVEFDVEGQFELSIGRIGDYGESTNVSVRYVDNGLLVTDDEFILRKTIVY